MAEPVRTVTRSELEHRRQQLLGQLGLTLAEFRELAETETRSLTSEEWDISEELDQIGFLLDDDIPTA